MTRAAVLICIALAAGAVVLRAAESLRIVPLIREEQVLVSFDMSDAYTDEVREAIASGLRTTFTYDVELRMPATLWVDRTIATAVIATSDQYDNLTRRHTLWRSVDGRVQESAVTEDERAARRWLTTVTQMLLCRTSKLEANREYYVRISARLRPQRGSIFGFTNAISSQTKFTFVP